MSNRHNDVWYRAVVAAGKARRGESRSPESNRRRGLSVSRAYHRKTAEEKKRFAKSVSKTITAHWKSLTPRQRAKRGRNISAGWGTASRRAQAIRMSHRRAKGLSEHPNGIEKLMWCTLSKLGLKFKFCPVLCGFVPDFVLENFKLIIECNGKYWHSLPEVKRRDRRKRYRFKKAGYTVLAFTDQQIRKSPQVVIDKILEKVR